VQQIRTLSTSTPRPAVGRLVDAEMSAPTDEIDVASQRAGEST
jgi:hypothetical protein